MLEPDTIDVATPAVQLRVLSWGPEDAPIALCLHGFPDTAYGWRRVAPMLVDAGWRVVAPFMRGYAPSSLPKDGSYHVGALMDDALRVLDAAGATGRDVIIGHDWGAIAGAGLAAMPDSPFAKAVIMSVPPGASFRPPGWGTRCRPPRRDDCRRSCCGVGTSCSSSCPGCQNVPRMDRAAAVAKMVSGISCRRGSPPRRGGDRRPRSVARRAGLLPRGCAQTQGACRSTQSCTSTGFLRRGSPRSICTAATTAVPQPITRTGWRRCCRMAARWRSSTAPGISCNSINPTSSRGTSSSSSGRRARPSSTPDDCGQPSATTVVAASDG